MTTLITLVILIGLIVFIIKDWEKLNKDKKKNAYLLTTNLVEPEESLPYKSKPKLYFFNTSEKTFYQTLKITLKNEYEIFSKVKLIDLLNIDTNKEYWKYKGKVAQQHIDFILCDPKELKIKLAIELDGNSHDSKKQKKKDEFKDEVLETINIPILRIRTKQSYDPKRLYEQIKNAIPVELTEVIE